MKRALCVLGICFLVGCSTTDNVSEMIRDKEFVQYKETLDQLESEYLQKKITYAEYLEKKKSVEEVYDKKISERKP